MAVAEKSKTLRAALGPMVALANPLDYHTFIWGDAPAMTKAFTAALSGRQRLGGGCERLRTSMRSFVSSRSFFRSETVCCSLGVR